MNRLKAIAKIKSIQANKEKRIRYALHLERQARRLERIGQLLHLNHNETVEAIELIAEWAISAGIVKPGSVKINKRIQ